MNNTSVKILLFLTIILWAVLTPNVLLTLYSLATIFLCFKILNIKKVNPVFYFIVLYHWLQISTKILYANIINVEIKKIALSSQISTAIYLSLISLIFFSFGLFLFSKKRRFDLYKNKIINPLEQGKLLKLYISFFVICLLLQANMFLFSGLQQVIASLIKLKSVIILLVFINGLVNKNYKNTTLVFIIEIIYGFLGFFSSFKMPFFLFLLAYFTIVNVKDFSLRQLKTTLPIGTLALFLGLIWTIIKTPYRNAISLNSSSQTVMVSTQEQFNLLFKYAEDIKKDDFIYAAEQIVNRMSYVDIFGYTIENVPKKIKHEKGKLWWKSFSKIFMPRFLFPEKENMFSDSERTNKYTGKFFAGADQGTSVSLGYYAESYIDFGYLMVIMLFLLGIFYAIVSNLIHHFIKHEFLGFLFISVIFLGVYTFEMRNDKVIGAIFNTTVIFLLIWKILPSKFFVKKYT